MDSKTAKRLSSILWGVLILIIVAAFIMEQAGVIQTESGIRGEGGIGGRVKALFSYLFG